MNFRELKAQLDAIEAERNGTKLAKSHGAAGDFGQSSDYDMVTAMCDLRRTPVVNTKGAHAALRKSMGALTKALPTDSVLGATHIEAPVAKPRRTFTAQEIEAACHKALAAGAITAAEANHCATHLALGHMPPPEMIAKLQGHALKQPKLLTKSQVIGAASAMLAAGTLSASDAQVIYRCLSFDRPVPDSLMKSIRTAHAGLK